MTTIVRFYFEALRTQNENDYIRKDLFLPKNLILEDQAHRAVI